MPALKAVFFDNDGVLVDTELLYFRATREAFARHGIGIDKETYYECFLRQGVGTWFLLQEKGYAPEEIEAVRQERNRMYENLLQGVAIGIDGVEAALRRLHGKMVMGIVTSSRRDHFEIIHRQSGILPYFDFSLTIEDYGKTKPAPEPYLKAVEKSGFRPDECLAVEDSERGLAAAVAARLRCIVIPRGMTRKGNFAQAYKVKKNLTEAVDEILREI